MSDTNEKIEENVKQKSRVSRLLTIVSGVALVNLILSAFVFDDPVMSPLISFILVSCIFAIRLLNFKNLADIAFSIFVGACSFQFLSVYPFKIGLTVGVIKDMLITVDPVMAVVLVLVLLDTYRSLDDTKAVL